MNDAGWWQRYWRVVHRLDPSVKSPHDAYADRVLALAPGRRWLDAGCGRSSLPRWRHDECAALPQKGTRAFGCDADLLALHERIDEGPVCGAVLERLPFRDASFELVTSNMVFEHLDDPDGAVRELARVTRPGGRILVHTVNGRHYLAWIARATPHGFHEWIVGRLEGRAGKDVYPTRYRANTVAHLEALFGRQGCRKVGGGEIPGLPFRVPVPVVFWIALALGFLERALARLPGFARVLNANLLVEFERAEG
jgi:SAM-dependent methyltransferase